MDTKGGITLVLYVYFLFVGIAYLWGYWLPFGIDILAFVDVTDIIKTSIYPLLPAIGVFLTYAALDSVNAISKQEFEDIAARGGFPKAYMFFMVALGWLVIIGAFLYSLYLIIVEPSYGKLKGALPLLSIFAYCYLTFGNRGLIKVDIKIRTFLVLAICFLPTAAFNAGNKKGNEINELSTDYWIVKATDPCPEVSGDLVLLARLSNKYITMDTDNKGLCIIESGSIRLDKIEN